MKPFKQKDDFVLTDHRGISAIQKVFIGNVEQSILIQAEDIAKPILLFLHGGPSMPMPGVSSRGRDYTIATNTKELVKHFVLVFWDQRGTGKSYHQNILQETMTVSQFVSDTIEITDYLREHFKKEKIFLVGHSWGTIIGLQAISQFPQKYYSYVGISQIVDWVENDRLSLIWAKEEAEKRNNKRAIRELNLVGEPPFVESMKQWGVLRTWQRNFGTLVYKHEDGRYPKMSKIAMGMLQSQDYSIKDIVNTFFKGFQLVYNYNFINDLPHIHFNKHLPKVDIPITFIHGTKDVHVHHGQLVLAYFDNLKAEHGKELIWMEKSGHSFHPDDTKRIESYLIEELKYVDVSI